MTAARIAAAAALATVVVWAIKAVAIWSAGGLDKSSLESPLFGLGLIAIVVAFGAFGVALAVRRAVSLRALAAVAGLAGGLVAVIVLDAASRAVLPDSTGWVEEEAGLWAAAVVAAAVTLFWLRSRDGARPTGTPFP